MHNNFLLQSDSYKTATDKHVVIIQGTVVMTS